MGCAVVRVVFRADEKQERQRKEKRILELVACYPDTPEKRKASHFRGE